MLSKATKEEEKQRIRDRRDDLLLKLNARRALECDQDSDNNDEESEAPNRDNSISSRQSQRPAKKRRREAPRAQSEVHVKVESVNKGLSKDDWKEIMATGTTDHDLRKEVNSLKSVVDELASSS